MWTLILVINFTAPQVEGVFPTAAECQMELLRIAHGDGSVTGKCVRS
jgi:hypothetical protein